MSSEEKALFLREGEWTDLVLQNPDWEFPRVELSLSFGLSALELRAVVHDLHFKDGDRSWRYGDGFLMNFVMPGLEEHVDSNRFWAIGFSMEKGESVAVLVGQNGTYYLRRVAQLTPHINARAEERRAEYRMAIPWVFAKPFDHLHDERGGINIRYVSLSDDGSRRTLTLVPDPHYDSEGTDRRRFAPIYFRQSNQSKPQFTGIVKNRLVRGDCVELGFAAYVPEAKEEKLLLSVKAPTKDTIIEETKSLSVPAGKTRWEETLCLAEPEPGTYEVVAALDGGASWVETFFVLRDEEIQDLKERIDALGESGYNPLLDTSVASLRYRLQELKSAIDNFYPRDNPEEIRRKLEDLRQLIKQCQDNGSIYPGSGYVRTAFVSPIDETIQPFSLCLPEGFNPDMQHDLVVLLHGSGVDEVDITRSVGKTLADLGLVTVGPRGRGLSDYYIGNSERDVLDVLETTKDMFRIGKVFLGGFSMGGYGAWRLSFLHPQDFDGVVIVSGMPYVASLPQHDVRDQRHRAINVPYLVVHGTNDRAVNIRPTDDFVEQLKHEGFDITYIRVEGAGHGDMRISDVATQWLKTRLSP